MPVSFGGPRSARLAGCMPKAVCLSSSEAPAYTCALLPTVSGKVLPRTGIYAADGLPTGGEQGEGYLWRRLAGVDPKLAASLHPRDRHKIVRALEVAVETGTPLSEWHQRHGFRERPFPSIMIGLTMDRGALNRRIDARVLREIEDGLIEETRQLLDAGYGEELGSMKALGYRQMSGYLKGRYGYDEAVRQLQRDTRRFAKRQMTWFRGDPHVHWLTLDEDEAAEHVADRILRRLEEGGVLRASRVA